MKKLILAAIVCAFFASPALANEFKAEQAKMLDNISTEIEQFKNDTVKVIVLTEKKECVKMAAELDSLKDCLAKFSLASPKTLN